MRVYVDGVFDLYHRGHLESFKYIKSEEFINLMNIKSDIYLIVGVVSDKDCQLYKRKPIINELDRLELIKYNKLVDEVIFPCPLFTTKDFIKKNKIDLVVHGFSDKNDFENQKKYFKDAIEVGKFKQINYYDKTSTTKIINKIKKYY